jgi:Flp pilus assembly protein TadD
MSTASVLLDSRKNYPLAGELYKKAIHLDPENAINMTNYGRVLVVSGDSETARQTINQALDLSRKRGDKDLELELWFYRHAMFYRDYPDAPAAIESLLAQGVTSNEPGLEDVVSAAGKRGHPDYERLSDYSKRISS